MVKINLSIVMCLKSAVKKVVREPGVDMQICIYKQRLTLIIVINIIIWEEQHARSRIVEGVACRGKAGYI